MLPENLKRDLIRTNAKAAIDRACQLIEELGAGEVVGGTVDVYGKVKNRFAFHLMQRKINVMTWDRYFRRRNAWIFWKKSVWNMMPRQKK